MSPKHDELSTLEIYNNIITFEGQTFIDYIIIEIGIDHITGKPARGLMVYTEDGFTKGLQNGIQIYSIPRLNPYLDKK